jgi:chemotaxis receptor (MCP) glutamine deamidase CheD
MLEGGEASASPPILLLASTQEMAMPTTINQLLEQGAYHERIAAQCFAIGDMAGGRAMKAIANTYLDEALELEDK